MANQKQRRRRAKEKRHEYDLVEIDEEGNETVLSASELESSSPRAAKPGRADQSAKPSRKGPQPPSWQKVTKRGLMFAPIFLATVLLLGGGKLNFVGAVIQTILLLGVFVPFSYLMDRLVWRSHEKRLAKAKASRS